MDFYWKKEWTVPAVGAVSFLAGAGLGVLFAKKKYQVAIDDISEVALKAMSDLETLSEVAQMHRTEADILGKKLDEANSFLEDFRKEGAQTVVLTDEAVAAVVDAPEMPEAYIPQADKEDPYVWTPEDDAEARMGDGAYILHQDEFFRGEKGYRQVQLEWYEGDKVLCDENHVVIYNPSKVVGQLIWGRGSEDPDVLYIRNDANRAEYEVHRNTGSYTIEVLGLDANEEAEADDIRHSQRIPRFKRDQD